MAAHIESGSDRGLFQWMRDSACSLWEQLGYSIIFKVSTLLCKVPFDNVYYDLVLQK